MTVFLHNLVELFCEISILISFFAQSNPVLNKWRWIQGMERGYKMVETRGTEVVLRWPRLYVCANEERGGQNCIL